MLLPKNIRFWLFKLKAFNIKQKIKIAYFTSAIWLLIVGVVITWFIFDKITDKPSYPSKGTNQEANTPIQVLLFNDETILTDIPKEITTNEGLDGLIKASQNTDVNIDQDLDKINF